MVAAFIEAGELAQGVADAAFAEHGCDARAQDSAMALLMETAGIVRLSWESGFRNIVPLPAERSIQLEAALLPESIRVKRPEGYAFYALYPEAYLEAAALGPRRENIRVIGIRSIGTGLAAMVAAALGAPAPATVRPAGHPVSPGVGPCAGACRRPAGATGGAVRGCRRGARPVGQLVRRGGGFP